MTKSLLRLLLLCAAFSAAAAPRTECKVFTIGNSFAASVFRYLPEVAASAKCKILLRGVNPGGCSMKRHCAYLEAEEKTPGVAKYGKRSLREHLTSQKWDVVTIQQVSSQSWDAKSFQPYAQILYDYVKKYAPQAEVMLQQTWAYRVDDPRINGSKKGWGFDQQGMHDRLSRNYDDIGRTLKIRQIPTGDAIALARKEQKGSFVPPTRAELEALAPGSLPNTEWSFIRGNHWRKDKKSGKDQLANDTIHLNARGEYLQACVWFAILFDRPTSEITFVPPELTAKDAAFLREIAQRVVLAEKAKFEKEKSSWK
ncbi:MAG: DUF4886 domain-containing protein [Victivallaceae bacterium]|nr:DUF4886 domain-containing protein [Victivallaceae bacterium]